MKLTAMSFKLFDRDVFLFTKLKEIYPEEEIELLKATYKGFWQNWKQVNLAAYELLTTAQHLPKPKVESWTNGWLVRSHFWAAYRDAARLTDATCLEIMQNRKKLRVNLMWQHYKCKVSSTTPTEYNTLLEFVPEWQKGIKSANNYSIWLSGDSEEGTYPSLDNYLASEELQNDFQLRLAKGETFCLGRIFPKGNLEQIEYQIAQTIDELDGLYTRH